MNKLHKILFWCNITAIVAVMLFSCGNPDAVVMDMASDDTLSGITADSVTFFRSDSGHVQLKLTAPRLVRRESNDENGEMEFPLGFHAFFFDNNMNPNSEISADYGKYVGDLIQATGNVVIINYENDERMYSDKLFWYQDIKMIYTRSHVRIVTPGRDIEGDSLVAKEDLSEYTIYYGRATMEVEDNL